MSSHKRKAGDDPGASAAGGSSGGDGPPGDKRAKVEDATAAAVAEAKRLRVELDRARAQLAKAHARREEDQKAAVEVVTRLLSTPEHEEWLDALASDLVALPDAHFSGAGVLALLERAGCVGLLAAQAHALLALLDGRLAQHAQSAHIQHAVFSRVLDRHRLDTNGVQGYYHPDADGEPRPLLLSMFEYRGGEG